MQHGMTTYTVDKIEVGDNIRSTMDQHKLEELADSIVRHGVQTPLIVSPGDSDDSVMLVAGHRRLAAIGIAQSNGELPPSFEVPVIVNINADEAPNRKAIQIIENLQREDISVIDEANGFADLKAQGLAQKDVAEMLSVSQAHVSKRLKLLTLPEDVQQIIDTGEVNLDVAFELASLDDEAAREIARRGRHATLREVRERKKTLKVQAARVKVLDQLEEAGVTVFANLGDVYSECPDGKIVKTGDPVASVDDLPKRLAGVTIQTYDGAVEIVPHVFRKPTKAEAEADTERQARQEQADAERAEEQKRIRASTDAFVDSPPTAAELVKIIARLSGMVTHRPIPCNAVEKVVDEAADEGRSYRDFMLSEQPSAEQSRHLAAAVVSEMFRTAAHHMELSAFSVEGLEALLDLGVELGLEIPEFRQERFLDALDRATQREEQKATQAEAGEQPGESSDDTEPEEEEVSDED